MLAILGKIIAMFWYGCMDSLWLGLNSITQYSSLYSINTELKMILLKRFCMHTKVAMLQHTSHEYIISSIASL